MHQEHRLSLRLLGMRFPLCRFGVELSSTTFFEASGWMSSVLVRSLYGAPWRCCRHQQQQLFSAAIVLSRSLLSGRIRLPAVLL